MSFIGMVGPQHSWRAEVESFVRTVYREAYGATLGGFPEIMAVRATTEGEILCAAGLRTCRDQFFSERYLDVAVERRLADLAGLPVARTSVFEVTTLASLSPLATGAFIQAIADAGERAGFDWAFCTITAKLQFLLGRQKFQPLFLANADPACVPDAGRWGSYYAHDPKVFAIASPRLASRLAQFMPRGEHAAAC